MPPPGSSPTRWAESRSATAATGAGTRSHVPGSAGGPRWARHLSRTRHSPPRCEPGGPAEHYDRIAAVRSNGAACHQETSCGAEEPVTSVTGQWRITEMDMWDREAIDLVQRLHDERCEPISWRYAAGHVSGVPRPQEQEAEEGAEVPAAAGQSRGSARRHAIRGSARCWLPA